jgi:hypothetical protein
MVPAVEAEIKARIGVVGAVPALAIGDIVATGDRAGGNRPSGEADDAGRHRGARTEAVIAPAITIVATAAMIVIMACAARMIAEMRRSAMIAVTAAMIAAAAVMMTVLGSGWAGGQGEGAGKNGRRPESM